MNFLKGTPKFLRDAIVAALESESPDEVVKDFVAQKFQVAYLKVENDAELERLEALYEEITKKGAA